MPSPSIDVSKVFRKRTLEMTSVMDLHPVDIQGHGIQSQPGQWVVTPFNHHAFVRSQSKAVAIFNGAGVNQYPLDGCCR